MSIELHPWEGRRRRNSCLRRRCTLSRCAGSPYDNGLIQRVVVTVNFDWIINTDVPAYSDTLGTWPKCHCKQMAIYCVTVTECILQ